MSIDEKRFSYQNRKMLECFWEKVAEARTVNGRLNLLKAMTNVTLEPDPYLRYDGKTQRKRFEKRKSLGHFRLKERCWACQCNQAEHRHHVIPIRNGGSNRAMNLVSLCVSCHVEAHRFDAIGQRRTS